MKLTALVLFSCLFVSIRAQKNSKLNEYNPDKKYSVEQARFDLAILKDALIKIHPGLYWYQTEQEFEAIYQKERKSIDRPMTELELYYSVMTLLSAIKCSHTGASLSKNFDDNFAKNHKLFPLGVKVMEDKLYISRNYSSNGALEIGSQLLEVNGIKTDSVLRYFKNFSWADGYTESTAMMEWDFAAFLSFYFYSETYVIKTIEPGEKVKMIEISAIDDGTFRKIDASRYSPKYTSKYKPFRFRTIDSLSTGIIRIDQFMGKGFDKFLKHTFKTLENKDTKNLIIDLRGNGGGEDYYGRLLYSWFALEDFKYYDRLEIAVNNPHDSIFKYATMPISKIAIRYFYAFKLRRAEDGKYYFKNKAHENLGTKPFKPQKDNFEGKVYILTDDESFSATSEFCAVAQYNKRAIFVGRETGGGYCGNSSGDEAILTLPNTKIRVIIPLVRYFSSVEGTCGRGVKPDYSLKEQISDLTEGKDSDLLFTLDLIKRYK